MTTGMRFRGLLFPLLMVFFAQGAALGEAVFEGPQDEIDAIFAPFYAARSGARCG